MRDDNSLPEPSRESSQTRTILPRPVEEIASEAVADLLNASEKLVKWGVKLPPNDRLSQAREILERAARAGEIVPAQRGDDLGLRSLELSFDYSAIADTLPGKRIAAVRKDLEASLTGDLDPQEEFMRPLQLQSQLVVRAAFVRAGLAPEHPTHSPKLGVPSPDLILHHDDKKYAIEVKRPKTAAGLLSRFDDARDQLAGYGLRGAVLIDVTDCVRAEPPGDIDKAVRRMALKLYDRTFVTGQGYKTGYEGIMVAGTFARVAWHAEEHPDHAMVNVHTSSVIGVFALLEGSVLDRHAKWIRRNFEEGLGRMYQTLSEVKKGHGPPDDV
jgi:hypothetical protein